MGACRINNYILFDCFSFFSLLFTISTGCTLNGQTVQDGREVTLSEDPCLKCSCSNRRLTCVKKACPILQCPLAKQIQLPGECCPKCSEKRTIKPFPGRCILGKGFYDDGKRYNPDKCSTCTCVNGTSICRRETCPVLECSPTYQKLTPGECCPHCRDLPVAKARSTCTYEGKTYQVSICRQEFLFRWDDDDWAIIQHKLNEFVNGISIEQWYMEFGSVPIVSVPWRWNSMRPGKMSDNKMSPKWDACQTDRPMLCAMWREYVFCPIIKLISKPQTATKSFNLSHLYVLINYRCRNLHRFWRSTVSWNGFTYFILEWSWWCNGTWSCDRIRIHFFPILLMFCIFVLSPFAASKLLMGNFLAFKVHANISWPLIVWISRFPYASQTMHEIRNHHRGLKRWP